MLARTESTLREVTAEIESHGVKVAYATADVSSQEKVEAAITFLTNDIGTADILINNAGISTCGMVLEMDSNEWKNIVDVNLMGTYYVTRLYYHS